MEPAIATLKACNILLHPVFGLDEDWNLPSLRAKALDARLHPVFGLDEDWNHY